MPFKSHEAFMREYLADPEMAAEYLKACLKDGNPWLIGEAYRLVEQIHGKKRHISIRLESNHPRRAAPKARRARAKRTRTVAA